MTILAFVPTGGLSGLVQRLSPTTVDRVEMYLSFMTPESLEALAPVMMRANSVQLKLGLDIPATSQRVLIQLRDLAARHGLDITLLSHVSPGRTFHPKLYIARTDSAIRAVIGSSNPSRAAFDGNVEANLFLEGPRHGVEEQIVDQLKSDLDSVIDAGIRSGAIRTWHLPGDPLPVIRPRASGRGTTPEVDEVLFSDGWQELPEVVSSTIVARFRSPLSGLFSYVLGNGHQGGIFIPTAERPGVEQVINAHGRSLSLSWRFRTPEGATVCAIDEPAKRVRLSGRGGHNRVITASRPTVARPVVDVLASLGYSRADYARVTYRLDLSGTGPRLWLIHELDRPTAAIDGSQTIS